MPTYNGSSLPVLGWDLLTGRGKGDLRWNCLLFANCWPFFITWLLRLYRLARRPSFLRIHVFCFDLQILKEPNFEWSHPYHYMKKLVHCVKKLDGAGGNFLIGNNRYCISSQTGSQHQFLQVKSINISSSQVHVYLNTLTTCNLTRRPERLNLQHWY